MKTLSLFAIAIMLSTSGMAQNTDSSNSIQKNNQWQQNSNQNHRKKSNKMNNHWNNKMDSTGNYDQQNPNKDMNQPNRKNRMNRQKANKSSVDSI